MRVAIAGAKSRDGLGAWRQRGSQVRCHVVEGDDVYGPSVFAGAAVAVDEGGGGLGGLLLEGEDVLAVLAVALFVVAVEEGEGGLAGVVGKEEVAGGGGAGQTARQRSRSLGGRRTRISQMAISSRRPRRRGTAISHGRRLGARFRPSSKARGVVLVS